MIDLDMSYRVKKPFSIVVRHFNSYVVVDRNKEIVMVLSTIFKRKSADAIVEILNNSDFPQTDETK